MRRKLALCAGINAYAAAPLSGCVNDAIDWSELLAGEGYEVKILLDGAATKAAILDTLRALVGQMGWGDRLVFQFSGHGSWLPDRNGDEPDGRDEVLCAYDYADGGLILDDELQAIFSGLRLGSGALFLSDSCHSGTVNRLVASNHGRARFLSPHLFTDLAAEDVPAIERNLPRNTAPRSASLISGCADNEYSYDAWFGGRAQGAFTHAALEAYRPGITLAAWHKAIRLPTAAYRQTPELHAASAYRKYVARAL